MYDIVIPTFNNEAYTVNCFKSIKRNTKDYRIIWVDNGSTNESREIVMNELSTHNPKTYSTIWLDKNYGFIIATNTGIETSLKNKTEHIILLNNDTTVTPNWIERLQHPLNVDASVMASGPLTDAKGSWQGWMNVKRTVLKDMPDLTGLNENEILESLKNKYENKYFYAPMIAFFCTLFRSKVFSELGLLDTTFKIGLADDDDMCLRIRKAGYKVCCIPSGFVYHHHRTTFKTLYTDSEILNLSRNNVKLFKEKNNIK